MKKKRFALLLCLVLVFSILPITGAAADPVTYLDENGVEQECTDYTLIKSTTKLTTGWYVLNSNVSMSSTYATASGDVRLILKDGCTLTASSGLAVTEGNSLTIYAQSTDKSKMGKLTATTKQSNAAGIGGKGSSGNAANSGVITINGGNITAGGGSYGAGIGGGKGNGTVVINGGSVTATGGNQGAGIGGGSSGSGTVTINGGNITADGGNSAAGIGGGGSGSSAKMTSSTVTINGGNITAKGGTNGAGIGGGRYGNGTVIISGGSVTATGGGQGAGIGGGNSGSGTVTINGGTVDATGGKDGAGIGSSNNTGGAVTISGGTVTADGLTALYAIGGATATINGGEIIAKGGSSAVIGGNSVTINGGNISASEGVETAYGIRGVASVAINGGSIYVTNAIKCVNTDIITLGEGVMLLDETGSQLTEEEWRAAIKKPEAVSFMVRPSMFFAHSLTLGSEISINFYLDIPEEYAGGTVTANITGRGGKTFVPEGSAYPYEDKTLMHYSVPLNVLQLAQSVTLTYTTEGGAAFTDTYSAEAYLKAATAKFDSGVTADIVSAVYDYGYWAQQYLDESNDSFALDVDYKALTERTAPEGVTAETLSAYAPDYSSRENVSISLLLDSKTALRVYFGNTAPESVTMNGNALTVEQNANGYYVELANLSAHQIGKVFTLSVDGETVKVSALSYCYQVLNTEGASANAKSCAAAIYNYYTATMAYRDAA